MKNKGRNKEENTTEKCRFCTRTTAGCAAPSQSTVCSGPVAWCTNMPAPSCLGRVTMPFCVALIKRVCPCLRKIAKDYNSKLAVTTTETRQKNANKETGQGCGSSAWQGADGHSSGPSTSECKLDHQRSVCGRHCGGELSTCSCRGWSRNSIHTTTCLGRTFFGYWLGGGQ